jgi:outer membrane autotransporter protein
MFIKEKSKITLRNLIVSKTAIVSNDIIVPVHLRVPMPRKTQAPVRLGQLTILSLALAASFVPLAAQADCTTGGSFTITASGTENWGAGNCSIASGVSISGGSPALAATNNVGTLTNNGVIRGGETGFRVNSTYTVGSVINNGTISASSTYGIRNQGTISSLVNSGSISSTYNAIYNTGLITLLNNSGLIAGSNSGIYNNGGATITSLDNTSTGTIQGTIGINNLGTISTLTNSGVVFGTVTAIYNGNAAIITSLLNSGTISGNTYGIQSDNGSSITSLNNTSTGLIMGGTGILVGNLTPSGTINVGTLTNAGAVVGTTNVGVGTSSNGTIGSLINSGVISGNQGAIGNAGSIGSVVNTGTITSSAYAVYNAPTGTLGPITNSGLISGTIMNLATRSLTINGGSGSTFGTLTGVSGSIGSADIGAISSTIANLYFGSGNLLLNDNINVSNNTISNTVSNTGATLQVNNHLSITGNYNQGASATLLIGVGDAAVSNGVAADTGYGRLIVSGAAVIASGSSVTLKALNSYAFATGQRYVVVQAATNGTNYNASSLVYSVTGYSGAVTGSVLVDGSYSDLLLTLGSGSTTTPDGTSSGSTTPNISATTTNAVAAISGLFNYSGANTSLLNVFNASAALGSSTEANRAGAQLSPTSNAVAATQASSAPTQSVLNVAGAHVDGLRIAQANGDSGVATGERANDVALWGQAFGGKATQDQRDNVSGYSANYNGLLIGGDKLLNDAWRVGGLVSYTNTAISSRDDNSGSSANLKSYGLIAYAGYTADSWYLDLSGGVVRHKYNTTRLIDFTGFTGTANGSYNGTQSVLSAEGGYPIRLDASTVFTPVAGLNYSKLKQDGYTESGGNGAALTVASNKSSSLKSDLGAKLERSFTTGYGSLAPSVQLTWRHEYQNTRLRSVASYAADTSGSTSFTTYGSTPIANTGIMALAATLTRSDNITLTGRYTVEAGSGYLSQTADVRLRYQF